MRVCIVAIVSVLLLVCCNRPDNPQNNQYAVTGVLNASADYQEIRVQQVDGMARPVTDAQVFLWHLDESHPLQHVPERPGTYRISAGDLPLAEEDYVGLRVEIGDAVLSSETVIPPSISLSTIDPIVAVNPSSTGAPLLELDWNGEPGLLYIMTADTIGVAPHPEIPFPVESGNFAAFFGLPFAETEQTVFDTDFAHYGLHRIRVFALPESYEEVFLYPGDDFTENLDASPDNIQNGSGYLTAVSQTSVAVQLE